MKMIHVMFTLAAVALAAPTARAGDGCGPESCGAPNHCARCGCHAACHERTCQVVCEMKTEIKTSWCVKCEEFAPLLPGRRCCECGCDSCGNGNGCGAGESCSTCEKCAKCGGRCEKCAPPPRCGETRVKKTLVKVEREVKVPVYKCVVKYLCNGCDAAQGPGDVTPKPAPVAPAPAVMPKPIAPPVPKHAAVDLAPLPPI